MTTTISNEFLTVTIDSRGAELVSIKTPDGAERLWTADPSVWNYHAPILFPWSGRMNNTSFTCNGKKYNANAHGFMRETEHKLIRQTEGDDDNLISVTFRKKSDDATQNLFPYNFAFEQTYSLDGAKLTHAVRITNTGDTTMPFGLGYHPGFICPFSEKKVAADYSVIFDSSQTPHLVLMEGGHPIGKTDEFMRDSDTIKLSNTTFENDSLCLTNLTAQTLTLQEEGSKNRIEFDIEGFPFVLLWSAPTETLRFVCIEPWHTIPDFVDAPTEWSEKKNLLQLPAGDTFDSQLAMTFYTE